MEIHQQTRAASILKKGPHNLSHMHTACLYTSYLRKEKREERKRDGDRQEKETGRT